MPVRRGNLSGAQRISEFVVRYLASLLTPPEGAVVVGNRSMAWTAAGAGVISAKTPGTRGVAFGKKEGKENWGEGVERIHARVFYGSLSKGNGSRMEVYPYREWLLFAL